jgi:colanic acid/amylovoran biosynthesis glycosyltransferase
MTPRRIAYVLNIFPKISETFIAGEIAELCRRGVDIRILSLLPPRNEPRHGIIASASLDRLTNYNVSAFNEILREFRPDLIHAHFAKEATEKARELSIQSGVPYTFTAHGYDIHRKPPPDFYERAMAARAVITVSKANAKHIHETFRVPEAQIHVVPCGVDISYFSPIQRSEAPAAIPLVVCVARQVEVKNLALLLNACALLRQRGTKFHCVMAGDGPLRELLLEERKTLGLDDIVEMPGAVDQSDVLKFWRRASVGVLTSDNEAMPVCLMEAAACGVPVVATAVGGIPELVQHGVTGLLCGRGDAKAISNALERLLTENRTRRGMGAAARLRAEEQFSLVRQVDQLQKIWANTLSGVPV